MRERNSLALGIAVAAGLTLLPAHSRAFDLSGAWATDARVCQKVFVKKGKGISIRSESEAHGTGFIVDANTIRGKTARCAIKTRKEDGAMINLLVSCSSDVMLSNMQVSLRVVNDNKIVRIYPGMEGIELAFDRCAM